MGSPLFNFSLKGIRHRKGVQDVLTELTRELPRFIIERHDATHF